MQRYTPADNAAGRHAGPLVETCHFPNNEGGLTGLQAGAKDFAIICDPSRDVSAEWGVSQSPSVPLLSRPENGADLNTELLFGEPVKVLERKGLGPSAWTRVKMLSNGEEGWIDVPLVTMSTEQFARHQQRPSGLISDLVAIVQDHSSTKVVPLGATIPLSESEPAGSQRFSIGDQTFSLQGGIYVPEAYHASRRLLVRTALSFMGANYRWGGRTIASGLDCSGLILTSARFVGIELPHSANRISGIVEPVASLALAKSGDLLFFAKVGAERISHVGVLLKYKNGGRSLLHASGEVRISPLDETGRYDGKNDIELRKIGRIV